VEGEALKLREKGMEIDITRFVKSEDPAFYSASKLELGENAGKITWGNAQKTPFRFVNKKNREVFREWLLEFGAWDDEDLQEMDLKEFNALFIQIISGDLRECGITSRTTEEEWDEIERLQQEGVYPSPLFRHKGRIYYGLG
jgi:hypothetical protein